MIKNSYMTAAIQRHYWRNLCCQAAAREVSSCQQETLHGFRRPGEGVWSSTSEGQLVGAEKTWVWRSGLCDWCRGCMQMRGAVSMLVRGTVKSLKWRLVFIKDQYSARCSHHCAWSLITRVPLWGPLGGPQCLWPCYHRWIAEGMCQEALDLERSYGEERTESKCRKTMIMICGTGLDFLQSSGEFPCVVCLTGVGSNSIFCNGCKHWVHKKCSGLKRLTKRPWLQMYTVPGSCMPLGWQTTEGGPVRTWQAWGGSFLLLPRRHALSSRWLWTFNHNTCENHLKEVQGSAIGSLYTPPLFQNTWPCVQLMCTERHAPCQRDLATDKAKLPEFAAKWQGNDQTDLQCQAARHCHHQVQRATCAAWHWGSGPHSEGGKTPMVWTCGTLQWCGQDKAAILDFWSGRF